MLITDSQWCFSGDDGGNGGSVSVVCWSSLQAHAYGQFLAVSVISETLVHRFSILHLFSPHLLLLPLH